MSSRRLAAGAAAILLALCPFAPRLVGDPPAVRAPARSPAATLVLGTYEVTPRAVIDGDTIRLPVALGAPSPGPAGAPADAPATSVRVLGLDAEEVFHDPDDRAAAAADFAAYAHAKRGDSPTPVKYGTPAGEAAKAFAGDLVRRYGRVRIEKDAPKERTLDPYSRLLAHVVLVPPAGPASGEVLLAEALIRAGHSPYFVKYGRSLRFDARLRAAEQEARAARRGIWGAAPPHYPDYAERLAWWWARAAQIDRWRALPASEDHVTLGLPEESDRLEGLVGRPVVVFGELRRLVEREGRRPWIFAFSDRPDRDFRAVVFDPAVFAAIDRSSVMTRYVTIRGKLAIYDGRPEVVVKSPEQIAVE